MPSKLVLSELQKAVSAEANSHLQYRCDAAILRNLGLKPLARQLKALAKDENSHLQRFIKRLVLLDEGPEIAPDSTIGHDSVTALLTNQLELERAAVSDYEDAIDICFAEKDSVTRVIFEKTLADEQDHVAFIQSQMDLIGDLGENQYIQSFIRV